MANGWESLRGMEAPGPDYFLPEVFTLQGGEVQGMETSQTDPKVQFNSAGISVTNAAGGKEVAMDANGLRLLATNGSEDVPTASRSVRWVRDSDGVPIANISGGKTGATDAWVEQVAVSPDLSQLAMLVSRAVNGDAASTGVYAKTFNKSRKVIDEAGESHFLQTGQATSRKSAILRLQFSWPGASVASNAITIASVLPAGWSSVLGVLSGKQDLEGHGFMAETTYNPGAGNINAVATQNASPVSPGGGITNTCIIFMYGN